MRQKQPVGIGMVGCGDLGNMILPHFTEPVTQERAIVVALCDIDRDKVEAARKQFGIARSYTDYNDFLADPAVELVLLLTPVQVHATMAIKALQSGKHVYVQKAMTANLAEADALVEVARASGCKAGAAPGQCFAPFFRKAGEILRAGTLGQVFWTFTNNSGRGSEYPWYLREGGGPLNTVTVYSLAGLTALFGPAKRVTAVSRTAVPMVPIPGGTMRREIDDNTLLLLEFAKGGFAFADGTDAMVPRSLQWGQFSLLAEKGALESGTLDMVSGWPTELILTHPNWHRETISLPNSLHPELDGPHGTLKEPHVYVDIMHLVDCIREDREPEISLEHGRHVVEIIEKAYQAAKSGIRQDLSTTF